MFYKRYEYLENPWYEDANTSLSRKEFLSQLDSFVNQKKHVRITLLNWDEEPLKEIQGQLTSGTISLDGTSAVRRTLSMTAVVNSTDYDVDSAQADFAINKKLYVEVGINNTTDVYPQYPILWFPQGLFFIKSFGCSSSPTSGVSISLSCIDKMAMLNGDIGGTFPATTILDEEDTQSSDGTITSEKVPIYRIIQEMVNHFGSEDLNNIVIEDVPLRTKQVVKWNGTTPLYLKESSVEGGGSDAVKYYIPSLNKTEGAKTYEQGSDCGYIMTDFTWPDELTVNAGDTVQTALEKIKSTLGNYEYFYDIYGVFHFREIKNYLNTTQSTSLLDDMSENDYLVEYAIPKEEYSFTSDSNLLSLNCTPAYDKIKNDYIVQGLRQATSSSTSYPVRYHLAIDTKPAYTTVNGKKVYGTWSQDTNKNNEATAKIIIYKELDTGTQKICWGLVEKNVLTKASGDFNEVYIMEGNGGWEAYVWTSVGVWKQVELVKCLEKYQTEDWRAELYMRGVYARHNHSTDEGYYFSELESAWPLIYDFANKRFWGQEASDETTVAAALCEGDYYLDFIDAPSSSMGEFAISSIGRRTDVVVDESINCLFEPEIPDTVFINATDNDSLDAEKTECLNAGISYCQMNNDMYSCLLAGGTKTAAWDRITFELYSHTYYQKSVTLTTFPVYHLEPNVRIKVYDAATNTNGDFMIQNMSLPLGASQTMSITASECMVKR